MTQTNTKTFDDFLGRINSLDSTTIETQKNNYLQAFNPPTLGQLNQIDVYDAATMEDYNARNENYIGFWNKVAGVAATENLTGRLILGGMLNFELETQEATPININGEMTTTYNIDDYMNSGQLDYFKTQKGGQEVINNYYAGIYDNMSSKRFTNHIVRDLQIGEMRADAQSTTGGGVADFAASAVGTILDPVTFGVGGALFKGGKYIVGAARAERALQAANAARKATLLSQAGTIVGETAAQSFVRLGTLEQLDSAQRNNFTEAFLEDVAYGVMFDGARVLLAKGLKHAFNRLPTDIVEKEVKALNKLDEVKKADIGKIEAKALPDEAIGVIQETNTIADASKVDWDAPENQGIETLDEFYKRWDEGTIKLLPESKADVVPPVTDGVKVEPAKTELDTVKIQDASDYLPDIRKGFINSIYNTLGNKVNQWFGYAIRFETTTNPITRALFTVYSKGVAGINSVGANLGRIASFIPFEDTQRFFHEKANIFYMNEYMPIIKQFANENPTWRKIANYFGSEKFDSAEQLKTLKDVHAAIELVRTGLVSDEFAPTKAEIEQVVLTSKLPITLSGAQKFVSIQYVKEILLKDYAHLFSSEESVNKFIKALRENPNILNPKLKYGTFGLRNNRILDRFTAAQLHGNFTLAELNKVFSIIYNVDEAELGGFKALLKSGNGPDTFDNFSRKIKGINGTNQLNDYISLFKDYFNNKHGGYMDVEDFFKVRKLLQENDASVRITLDAQRNLMNTSRLLAKLEAANNIINRVKEFAVLENKEFGITQNRFTKLLDRYNQIQVDLNYFTSGKPDADAKRLLSIIDRLNKTGGKADAETVTSINNILNKTRGKADVETLPSINNRLNKWIEDFIDETTSYNKDVVIPKLAQGNVEVIKNLSGEADLLKSYLRRKFGIDRAAQASKFTEMAMAGTHGLLLQGSGINFILEGAKAMSNSIAMGNYNQIGSLYKSIKNWVFRNRKIGNEKINSQILESLITLQETNASFLMRMTSELEDGEGLSYEPSSLKDKAVGVLNAWRAGIQRLSLAKLSSDMIKHYAFVQEFTAHTNENGLINLSAKIVNKIEQGMTTEQAVSAVIKSEGLSRIGLKADNLFYNYNQMAKYFTFAEIKELAGILVRLKERSNKTFDYAEIKKFMDPKVINKFKVDANNLHASASYLINPDDLTVNQMAELIGYASKDVRNIAAARDAFKKFGRYINSQIDDRNLNTPSSVSDFTGTGTHTFPFRAMTTFFRSATATLMNNTYGTSNRGTATKLYFALAFTGSSVAINAVKNAMSGKKEELNTPLDYAKYALQVGDYAGFLPTIITNPISNVLNPGRDFVNIPIVDVASGIIKGGKTLPQFLRKDLNTTSGNKRWARKLISLNFADTTGVRLLSNGINNLIGENEDFNKIKEFINYVYDRK